MKQKMMTEKPFTRLTVEQSDKKFTWEIPYEDITVNDILDALNGILVGMTFNQNTIYDSVANWLSNVAYDTYEVIEKHENDDEVA